MPQSEYGDLYKVTLDWEGETVRDLRVQYFDTIPAATSIAVMRRGFLFAASETGDHALYQFQVRHAVLMLWLLGGLGRCSSRRGGAGG